MTEGIDTYRQVCVYSYLPKHGFKILKIEPAEDTRLWQGWSLQCPPESLQSALGSKFDSNSLRQGIIELAVYAPAKDLLGTNQLSYLPD